jgi:hypothetical protein
MMAVISFMPLLLVQNLIKNRIRVVNPRLRSLRAATALTRTDEQSPCQLKERSRNPMIYRERAIAARPSLARIISSYSRRCAEIAQRTKPQRLASNRRTVAENCSDFALRSGGFPGTK